MIVAIKIQGHFWAPSHGGPKARRGPLPFTPIAGAFSSLRAGSNQPDTSWKAGQTQPHEVPLGTGVASCQQ